MPKNNQGSSLSIAIQTNHQHLHNSCLSLLYDGSFILRAHPTGRCEYIYQKTENSYERVGQSNPTLAEFKLEKNIEWGSLHMNLFLVNILRHEDKQYRSFC